MYKIMEADPKDKKNDGKGGEYWGNKQAFFSTWDFHQSNFPEENPLAQFKIILKYYKKKSN
jgi:hypothetical protein